MIRKGEKKKEGWLGNRVLEGVGLLNQLFLTPVPPFYSRVFPREQLRSRGSALYITGRLAGEAHL